MYNGRIEITFKMAWWFYVYMLGLWAVAKFCQCFGVTVVPDSDKVEYWAKKGIKLYVNGKRIRK